LRLKICWRKTTKAKQDLTRSLRYVKYGILPSFCTVLPYCTVLRLILQPVANQKIYKWCKLMFSTFLYSVWTQSHHSWWKRNAKLHFWMKTKRKTERLKFIHVCIKKWVSKNEKVFFNLQPES
jgi:hypothetical protein